MGIPLVVDEKKELELTDRGSVGDGGGDKFLLIQVLVNLLAMTKYDSDGDSAGCSVEDI